MTNVIYVTSLVTSAFGAAGEVNANPPIAKLSVLFKFADKIVELWLAFLTWFGKLWEPIMVPLFRPVNAVLANTYMPWARISSVGLFVAAMVWVCFFMDKEYVNLGRKKKTIWTDLRLWTVISMLPHIFVYLYF